MNYAIYIVATLLACLNLSRARIPNFAISDSTLDQLPDAATLRHLLGITNDPNAEYNLVWESDTDPEAVRRGNKNTTSSRASARVCGGQEAKEGQFPFAAYIEADEYYCSGSVIAPRVILTAAHCIRDEEGWELKEDLKVWVGAADYNSASSTGRDIQAMYTPKYNFETEYGDIALLHLKSAVPSSIKPITLASKSTSLSRIKRVTICGWGLTEDDEEPEILRYTTMPVLTQEKCKQFTEDSDMEWAKDHICFGLGSSAACVGDSGGPFMIRGGGKPTTQVAVVSFGPDDEVNLDSATSVIYWRSWIDGMMKIHNMNGK